MKPFWEPALAALQEIAHEPVAPLDELRNLQKQLATAIYLVETNQLSTMTEQERIDHASRFGPGAFVVGDYVIKKR